MTAMMAPLPAPTPSASRPELPRVRLEVRTGTGRTAGYEIAADEFLIGGAAGCDLRLPGSSLPPVVLQLTRKPDGVRARRLAPGLAVLLNGTPLASNAATPVQSEDRISVAGVEITVGINPPAFLSPRLIPLAAPEPAPPKNDVVTRTPPLLSTDYPALSPPDRPSQPPNFDRERLETEYRRRMESLDREVAARVAAAEAAQAEQLRHRTEELDRTRAALDAETARLNALREQVDHTAREERSAAERLLSTATAASEQARTDGEAVQRRAEELAAVWSAVNADKEQLREREANLNEREVDVARREEQLRVDRDETERLRRQLADDLLRLDRQTAAAAEKERLLDARTREVNARTAQLKRDAAEWEETVTLAAAEQERLRAEAERLDRQKAELDVQTGRLAERSGQLEAQQAGLAMLRAKLERTRDEVAREAAGLAEARGKEGEAWADLRARIVEAEQLRAELGSVQEDAERERRRLEDRDSLLAAGLEQIRQQGEALAAAEARLHDRERDLDGREAEFAEQAGTLKGRMTQALDLQARLEADRVAIREREAALARAEEARQTLQEQLRRRVEELAARSAALDDEAHRVAADREAVDRDRLAHDTAHAEAEQEHAEIRRVIETRAEEVAARMQAVGEREAALNRQVSRLREVGGAVAAEKKSLAAAREQWHAERTRAEAEQTAARERLDAFRSQVAGTFDALKAELPDLEAGGQALAERLAAAREVLRGHLAELHTFALRGRDELEAVRRQVHEEAERVREREQALDQARAEHRLAVIDFRQQLIDWQARVAEMKQGLNLSETRLDARQAAIEEAARQVDVTSHSLAEQAEELRRERAEVARKRNEMDGHLADMREWYRRKLRELAASNAGRTSTNPPGPRLAPDTEPVPAHAREAELDPGDRQLGTLLRSLELVDADTLAALWAEAERQRRPLRQVLLSSGTVTLYQLALMEAGNLDGLMLGRFRVIDRLRASPHEAVYRVLDPNRQAEPGGGFAVLRHLSESDALDAVRPDEFRQRFAAVRACAHPNLVTVFEVIDINGRPAVVEEWLTGLPSPDWPVLATNPGCWVRLMSMAASGMASAHAVGLVHGRLSAHSFVLTPGGVLKTTGFGEPPGSMPVTKTLKNRPRKPTYWPWARLARPGPSPCHANEAGAPASQSQPKSMRSSAAWILRHPTPWTTR